MKKSSYLYCLLMAGLAVMAGCKDKHSEPAEPATPGNTVENVYEAECRWIYGQMNRNYLWREDLPDSLNCDYLLPPHAFFNNLLSPKDRFSYIELNNGYSPPASDYGFEYQPFIDNMGDLYWQVLYVRPAIRQRFGIKRGEFVKPLNRTANTLTLRRGEFLDNRFVARAVCSIEAVVSDVHNSTVLLDSIYEIGGKRIGYLCYLKFDRTEDLEPALTRFAEEHIDELILDLRYNPGGFIDTSLFLSNAIVTPNGYGQLFQRLSYNNVLSASYRLRTGDECTYSYFDDPTDRTRLRSHEPISLGIERLVVLTSKYTASASEATVIALRPFMPVVIIGERTVGKGVGSWTVSDSRYKYKLHPIIFRYWNAASETTPDDGLAPDIEINGGYYTPGEELGNLNEPLLAAAITSVTGYAAHHNNIKRVGHKPAGLVPAGEPSFVTTFKQMNYEL